MRCPGCGRDHPSGGCDGGRLFPSRARAAHGVALTAPGIARAAQVTAPGRVEADASWSATIELVKGESGAAGLTVGAAEDAGADEVPDAETASDDRRAAMRRDLRGGGVWLMLCGVVQVVLSSFLDPAWGMILLVVGALIVLVPIRAMYLVVALGMLISALANLLGDEIDGFTFLGMLQVYWTWQQVRSFRKYGRPAG